jgi:hypothetical protein
MSWWWLAAAPFVPVGFGVLWLLWWSRGWPSYQELDAGTYANHFVHVDEDGTARELTADEKIYLNTRFHPNDGARPYIKYRYGQKTPNGEMSGFLLRRRVPRAIPIAPD